MSSQSQTVPRSVYIKDKDQDNESVYAILKQNGVYTEKEIGQNQQSSNDTGENSQFAPTTKDDGVTQISISDAEFVSPTNAQYDDVSSNTETFDDPSHWTLQSPATISGGIFDSGLYNGDDTPRGIASIQNLGSSDFMIDIDLKMISYDLSLDNVIGAFGVSDHDNVRENQDTGDLIGVQFYPSQARFRLHAKIDSNTYTSYSSYSGSISWNVQYYCRLKRVANTVTFEVFSNPTRTTLVTSISFTVNSNLNNLDRFVLAYGTGGGTTIKLRFNADNISGVTWTRKNTTALSDSKTNPTLNYIVSSSVINPNVMLDTGSVQEILGVAIHFRAETTITKFKIETSADGINWIRRKTVPYFLITVNQWNIILFPRPPKATRYLKITGLDATVKVIGMNEVTVFVLTESVINRRHRHIFPFDPNSDCQTLLGA